MAEPPRRGGRPIDPRAEPPDLTTEHDKATPVSGTELPLEARPTRPRRAAANIVDELLDEPTRSGEAPQRRPRSETVPYSKVKFGGPNDPMVKTQINERPVTARRLPAVTDIPEAGPATLRDMPAIDRDGGRDGGRERERERVLTPSPVELAAAAAVAAAQQQQRAIAAAVAAQSLPPTVDAPSLAPDAHKTKVWVATHKLPADPDERLILLREPDSARAAAYRVLRHRLAEQHDPRVIVVSSPEAGEGKTTCAVNLALALGECGRARVLLLEANLRTPTLAALFGFLPPECFAAQLQRHRERPQDPWSVVEVGSPSLHVAAVKPIADGERPLLDGVAFGIALDMLRRAGYDYLVLDTPPVLGSADVNLVEDFADGVLLVTRARTTSGRKLRAAVDQLQPGKILGVTLIDA
jgi:Mrp family chromosome partitioning ATPase